MRVWDVDGDTAPQVLTGHRGAVTAVAVLPGPQGRHRIVSGGDAGMVLVWISF